MALLQSLKAVVEKLAQRTEGKFLQLMESIQTCPAAEIQPALSLPGSHLSDGIVWSQDAGCRRVEDRMKVGPICRRPDYRRRPIPPFEYGYCKEEEEELPTFCPPRRRRKSDPSSCCNQIDGNSCD
ncbi:uncharacterized protein LOC106661271 [Cimex lectularius]|uniref:Uncharacterized protein n=1 Tax=Cimex lectularius TaxID=79782 RepID=A0A8I6RA60_CIMLE|nr:uncharacterized protein LOC106661271 [Cimex lectularius]